MRPEYDINCIVKLCCFTTYWSWRGSSRIIRRSVILRVCGIFRWGLFEFGVMGLPCWSPHGLGRERREHAWGSVNIKQYIYVTSGLRLGMLWNNGRQNSTRQNYTEANHRFDWSKKWSLGHLHRLMHQDWLSDIDNNIKFVNLHFTHISPSEPEGDSVESELMKMIDIGLGRNLFLLLSLKQCGTRLAFWYSSTFSIAILTFWTIIKVLVFRIKLQNVLAFFDRLRGTGQGHASWVDPTPGRINYAALRMLSNRHWPHWPSCQSWFGSISAYASDRWRKRF